MPMRYVMSKEHYEEELDRAGDKLVVMTWSVTWADDYRNFDPTLMKLSDEYTDVYFVACDCDDAKELRIEMEVKGVPCFWFLKDKKIVDTIEGVDEAKFRENLEKFK